MDDRALMQMALDALKVVNDVGVSANWHRHFDNQIKALRERLAQQEPEPVAWAKFNQGEITHSEMTDGSGCDFDLKAAGFVPLYTAPITRQKNRQVAKNATTGNQEVAKSATTEWVGLTEQDVHDAFQFTELVKQLSFDRERPEWCQNFAAYLEAKLKEKNNAA
jgi:hypothetical protein